jgi:hypothetical protein
MKAHTITTISRRRRSARRRRVLALALGVCVLAIPAATSAAPIDAGAIAGEEAGQSAHGAGYSLYANPTTPNATLGEEAGQPADGAGDSLYANPTTPNATLGADGVVEPTHLTGSPAGTSDGFDWVSALVGAGAAMCLAALGGAALLTVRRRTPVPPPAPTS